MMAETGEMVEASFLSICFNSRKTFQTESRTQVGDRAGSLVACWSLVAKSPYAHAPSQVQVCAYQTDTTRKTVCWNDIYEVA